MRFPPGRVWPDVVRLSETSADANRLDGLHESYQGFAGVHFPVDGEQRLGPHPDFFQYMEEDAIYNLIDFDSARSAGL